MLELTLDEFERRERARLEQQATLGGALELSSASVGINGRPACFRTEVTLEDRHERFAPAAQRRGIARAEFGERRRGALEIRPPAARRSGAPYQGDGGLGLDV